MLVVDACASAPPPDATPARRALISRLHEFHASPRDCVDIAAAAGVRRVVLTHHLPEARPQFDSTADAGDVLIGCDLDVIVA